MSENMTIPFRIFFLATVAYLGSTLALWGCPNTSAELFIVRGSGEYPPNEMVVEGKLMGVHIDLVQGVAQILKCKVSFDSVPWSRALSLVERGEADAITYIGKTPEREKFTYYSEGNIISDTENALLTRQERASQFAYSGDLHSLTAYSIGTLRGYSYGAEFDTATYLQKLELNDMEQFPRLLDKGRIDLAIVNVMEYKYNYRAAKNFDQYVFLRPSVAKVPNYLGFSKAKKNHAELAERFAQAMLSFKATEGYQQLLKKYGLQ